jgi:hypothetical protein
MRHVPPAQDLCVRSGFVLLNLGRSDKHLLNSGIGSRISSCSPHPFSCTSISADDHASRFCLPPTKKWVPHSFAEASLCFSASAKGWVRPFALAFGKEPFDLCEGLSLTHPMPEHIGFLSPRRVSWMHQQRKLVSKIILRTAQYRKGQRQEPRAKSQQLEAAF